MPSDSKKLKVVIDTNVFISALNLLEKLTGNNFIDLLTSFQTMV